MSFLLLGRQQSQLSRTEDLLVFVVTGLFGNKVRNGSADQLRCSIDRFSADVGEMLTAMSGGYGGVDGIWLLWMRVDWEVLPIAIQLRRLSPRRDFPTGVTDARLNACRLEKRWEWANVQDGHGHKELGMTMRKQHEKDMTSLKVLMRVRDSRTWFVEARRNAKWAPGLIRCQTHRWRHLHRPWACSLAGRGDRAILEEGRIVSLEPN